MYLPTLNTYTSNAEHCTYYASSDFAHPSSLKRTSKRRIHFNETVTVHIISERSSEMSPQDKLHAYYSEDELMRFESEVKEVRARIIHQARTMSNSNPAVSPAENVSSILKSDASMRGFEVRFCPTRCRRKLMVLNAVHDYHKKLQLMEKSLRPRQIELALAKAYAQLSHWSKIQALHTAKNDQIQAFQQCDENDAMRAPTSSAQCTSAHLASSVHVISPGAHRKKRKVELSAEEGHQKMGRVC
eukprot:CCRYP_019754-RA/>CCRYP_019754-RA protein AED:0.29 eAED:0.29 QI:0/-1/0/1/-1/1/1/0/243